MKKHHYLWITALLATMASAQARPLVLELYTSQGCSSCPPADALLTELAKKPEILALSFHVQYWDYLGWKDPFSSQFNTDRQRQYAAMLHENSVFTPQLVVDGTRSVVGSDSAAVAQAVQAARKDIKDIALSVSPDVAATSLLVHIPASELSADVYAVRYQRHATTQVTAGENGGRNLSSINNVTEFTRLGALQNQATDYHILLPHTPDEGIAVIVQASGPGRIVSAINYTN